MAFHYNVGFSTPNRLSRLRKKVKRAASSKRIKVEVLGKICQHKDIKELHVFVPASQLEVFLNTLHWVAPTSIETDEERLSFWGQTLSKGETNRAHIIYAL